MFELDNRSKRSIALDLTSDDGLGIAIELIADADVFVTNLRIGALERLGLGAESICERFPRLVYCHITGYGREGDDADRAAYDVAAFWSRSGIAHLLTEPGGDPPFQRGGMGDHSTGISGAAAVSAALFARERSGEGQLVSTSLFRQGIYTIGFDVNILLMWGAPMRLGVHAASKSADNHRAGFSKSSRQRPSHLAAIARTGSRTDQRDHSLLKDRDV